MIDGGCAMVTVSDLEAAARFYREVLGLAEVLRIPGRWVELDAGRGFRVALRPARGGDRPAGGRVVLAFGVDEPLDHVVARLRARGLIVTDESADPDVRMAGFEDPEGNALLLWEARDRGAGG